MPINRQNQRAFTRKLFAGMLEKIRFYVRGDDQREGVVRTEIMFECRRSLRTKTGEPIQGEMTSNDYCTWHIPRRELDRVGIPYVNAADKIEQLEGVEAGTFWQPESTTRIDVKLLAVEVDVGCWRRDPPRTA